MHLFTRPMHLHQILSWIVILILLFLFLAKKNWRVFKCLYSCYLTQWCTQLYACNVAVWSKAKIAPSHLGCSEIDYIFVWKKTKQALLKCYRIKNIDLFLEGLPTFEGKIGSWRPTSLPDKAIAEVQFYPVRWYCEEQQINRHLLCYGIHLAYIHCFHVRQALSKASGHTYQILVNYSCLKLKYVSELPCSK